MTEALRRVYKRVIWFAFRLPLTLILIGVGMVFEFLVSLPFAILCRLDGRSRRA